MPDKRQNEILQAALRCAERGWLVLPCHNENKRPLTARGLKDATRDVATITAWFTRWPGAMIGIKCGRESGVFVVDCDVDPAKGLDAVAAFKELFSDLLETITVKTPRGGRHYYFKYPDDGTEIRNSAGKICPGCDVRGEGGYVIAGGSRRSDRVYYETLADVYPDPPPAPQRLLDLVIGKTETAAPAPTTPALPVEPELAAFAKAAASHRHNGNGAGYGVAALDAEAARVAGAPRGQRNHTLNRAAFSLGQLVATGVLQEAEVRLRLREAASTCGLIRDSGGASVVATLNSGLSAGMAQPRGIPERRPKAKDDDEPPPPPSSPPTGGWQFHDETPAPPTPWLIKNLLPETGTGLMSGQWGTYKTTMALDLSVSVMAGPPFARRFMVKRRGGVAYFAVEGSAGLKARLDAAARERGCAGILPFAWRSDCPPLTASNALHQLAHMAKETDQEFEQRFGVELVLIFVDTVIAAAGYANTGDDNDAAVSQKVMSVLSRLSRHTGALVLGIDHFGKVVDGGTRGSSNKEGHADVVLALLGDRQINGTITNTRFAVRKLRDGPSGLELPFAPKDVSIGTDADGEPVTLMTMLADAGTDVAPFADGPVVRAVDLKLVRAEFYKQYPADGDDKQKANVRRQAFGRAVKDAQVKSLINTREVGGVQLVWLVSKTEEPT